MLALTVICLLKSIISTQNNGTAALSIHLAYYCYYSPEASLEITMTTKILARNDATKYMYLQQVAIDKNSGPAPKHRSKNKDQTKRQFT